MSHRYRAPVFVSEIDWFWRSLDRPSWERRQMELQERKALKRDAFRLTKEGWKTGPQFRQRLEYFRPDIDRRIQEIRVASGMPAEPEHRPREIPEDLRCEANGGHNELARTVLSPGPDRMDLRMRVCEAHRPEFERFGWIPHRGGS